MAQNVYVTGESEKSLTRVLKYLSSLTTPYPPQLALPARRCGVASTRISTQEGYASVCDPGVDGLQLSCRWGLCRFSDSPS